MQIKQANETNKKQANKNTHTKERETKVLTCSALALKKRLLVEELTS